MEWRLFFLLGLFVFKTTAQHIEVNKNIWMLGLNYGWSSQEVFLLDNEDYSYDNYFLKVQINYLLLKKEGSVMS